MTAVYTDVGKGQTPGYINKVISLPTNFYIASGTGAGAATGSSVSLSTESSEGRVVTTNSILSTTKTNDTSQWVGTITYTGTKTITNAGVFDANASGNLLLIADSISIAVNANDQIAFTFQLKQS